MNFDSANKLNRKFRGRSGMARKQALHQSAARKTSSKTP